ncbi:hypothetical protein B0H34DRAFT_710104 [Crassisporium funariophilum]|nr:hypothetical protein B0H34DRAFT_710104 [Crassisporium funariophilum]
MPKKNKNTKKQQLLMLSSESGSPSKVKGGSKNKKNSQAGPADNPPKQPELTYSTVIIQKDGSLTCNCAPFCLTKEVCYHILAARLEIAYGPSSQYTELEKAQMSPGYPGYKAKGKAGNSHRSAGGHQYEAVSDASVATDMDYILASMEEDPDTEPPSGTASPTADGFILHQLKAMEAPQKVHDKAGWPSWFYQD